MVKVYRYDENSEIDKAVGDGNGGNREIPVWDGDATSEIDNEVGDECG